MRKPGSEVPVSDAGDRLALLDADLVADEEPNDEVHEFVACVVQYPADAVALRDLGDGRGRHAVRTRDLGDVVATERERASRGLARA